MELPYTLGFKPSRSRCPACGFSKVAKIVYGYPSHELFEAAERGEVVLSGCCVNGWEHPYVCRDCGKNFGGSFTAEGYLREDIKSFFFYIGGFGGTSHCVYICIDRENIVMRYINSEGFLYIDIKDKIPE